MMLIRFDKNLVSEQLAKATDKSHLYLQLKQMKPPSGAWEELKRSTDYPLVARW